VLRLRSAPCRRDFDSLKLFRRVPMDTRGMAIIPQNPILRHGESHRSFVNVFVSDRLAPAIVPNVTDCARSSIIISD